MPRYLFSLSDKPPSDEFAIDLPDDLAAIREAGLIQEDFTRTGPTRAVSVNVWDECGRRIGVTQQQQRPQADREGNEPARK
jgi:hypothetical protein